jgi:hypothetical protein
MAGFGTLILSRHQGLRSMGQLLTLGVGLCLACTVLFLPSLLVILTRQRKLAGTDNEEFEESEEFASPEIAAENLANDPAPEPSYEFVQPAITRQAPEISYYRLELPATEPAPPHVPLPPEPSPSLAPLSPEETFSLEAFRDELQSARRAEERLEESEFPSEPETFSAASFPEFASEFATAQDGVQQGETMPAEFAPLVFGQVTKVIPRRRTVPRRVDEDTASPVETEADQVN